MRDSFGDVAGEIQAIAERAAIVPDAFDLVWVEGPDAVRFLQGLLSQEIESMAPGTVARAFLLAPQGKLRALCWVVRDESRVGLAVDAGWADRVIDDLTNYRIRVKAELRREDRPVTSVWGPDSTRLVGLADAERWQESAGVLLAPIPMPGLARVLVVGDVDLADVPRAGRLAAAAQRVAAGEPEFGRSRPSPRRRGWCRKPCRSRRGVTSVKSSWPGSTRAVTSTGGCGRWPSPATCSPPKAPAFSPASARLALPPR